ncbi:Protein phosphatase 1 regulatory subunit 7 [Hondaea fermentalgiana]|uniref:Protein phosphatase 1 regulatory subunit 7 n=1 Tax=Hondaea fermentalgiana TaxID=2315210 RepID=A0A2R5GSU4_9STRA|nr:Protein phosphatase 1 regulatory subunit 7 [Hondaea fermentalgiana]|eukprot:GBG33379.1 Protein phosphatase 1 regulatory subunit 7 [Hondaea fermentalgiana]
MTEPSIALITKRAGLARAENVQRLNLENLGLGHVGRLQECRALEDLCLADNKITTLEGLGALRKLRRLDVSGNRLQSLAGIEHLDALEELFVQGNQIESWDRDIRPYLLDLPRLRVLHLKTRTGASANPLCASEKAYPTMILQTFPQIEVIDGNRVHLTHVRHFEAAEPLPDLTPASQELPEPKQWTWEVPSSFQHDLLDTSLQEAFATNLSDMKMLLAEADKRLERHFPKAPGARPGPARRQLRRGS